MPKAPPPNETSPLISGTTLTTSGDEYDETTWDYSSTSSYDDGSSSSSLSPEILALQQDHDYVFNINTRNKSKGGRISGSMSRLSMSVRSFIAEHTGSIGYLGSMSIAVNSLTGPAMVNLPSTFARSGIIPTISTILFVCIFSALCCMHLSNTISKVTETSSGRVNSDFKQKVEYSDCFQAYWGKKGFIVTQVLFFCCVTCLNISSIVDTAQVVDTFLGHWWPGGATALKITRENTALASWDYSRCTDDELVMGDCLPYANENDDGIMLKSGNFIVSLIFMPLALMDLKENAFAQIVGFVVLLITCLQFVIQFSLSMLSLQNNNISWWGYEWDDLFGVVLFNFALVIAIPAWLYEKEPHVDVPTVVRGSSGIALFLYIAIGLLGSLAMPHASENMLQSMMSGSMGTAIQLSASTFALFIVGLGIPLFSVLARLNLTGRGHCSRRVGNIFAVYLPFAVSWCLNDTGAVTTLLSWGGTILTSCVAFFLPLLLTIYVVRTSDLGGSVPVYWGWFTLKRSELTSLYILLALTTFAIVTAIIGNIVD